MSSLLKNEFVQIVLVLLAICAWGVFKASSQRQQGLGSRSSEYSWVLQSERATNASWRAGACALGALLLAGVAVYAYCSHPHLNSDSSASFVEEMIQKLGPVMLFFVALGGIMFLVNSGMDSVGVIFEEATNSMFQNMRGGF